jgi:hypothetical protein
MYGICREVRIKNISGKVCRIRVTGGSMTMTTQEILAELEVLVLGNKKWEFEEVGS